MESGKIKKIKKRDTNYSNFQIIGKLQGIINKTNNLVFVKSFKFFQTDFQFLNLVERKHAMEYTLTDLNNLAAISGYNFKFKDRQKAINAIMRRLMPRIKESSQLKKANMFTFNIEPELVLFWADHRDGLI